MIRYIDFTSKNERVEGEECTTRWSSKTTCNIILSGVYNNEYHKIMAMEAVNDVVLDDWISKNVGKVREITKNEADILGKAISPAAEKTIICGECGNVYRRKSSEFTIDKGQTWDRVVSGVK